MADPVASPQGPVVPLAPLLTAQSQPLSGGATSARAHPLRQVPRNKSVRTSVRVLDMQAIVADAIAAVHGGTTTLLRGGDRLPPARAGDDPFAKRRPQSIQSPKPTPKGRLDNKTVTLGNPGQDLGGQRVRGNGVQALPEIALLARGGLALHAAVLATVVQHGGAHRAGANHADLHALHAMQGGLDAQGARQAHQGVLAGGVGDAVGRGTEAGHGGHVDDVAEALPLVRWHCVCRP